MGHGTNDQAVESRRQQAYAESVYWKPRLFRFTRAKRTTMNKFKKVITVTACATPSLGHLRLTAVVRLAGGAGPSDRGPGTNLSVERLLASL